MDGEYAELIEKLGIATRAGHAEPQRLWTIEDIDALRSAPEFDGPPQATIHVWIYALNVVLSGWEANTQVGLEVTRRIAHELLRTERIPTGPARSTALPLVEALVLAGVYLGDSALARDAARRLSQSTNELFLAAGAGPDFLSMRAESGFLRQATYAAFDAVDRRLAVECAETGRMKLLSAVAAQIPFQERESESVPRPSEYLVGAYLELIRDPTRESILDFVNQTAGEGLAPLTYAMVSDPWVRLLWSIDDPEPRLLRSLGDRSWRLSLQEPTLEHLGSMLGEGQLLVYPFVRRHAIGFIAISSHGLASIDLPRAFLREHYADEIAVVGETGAAAMNFVLTFPEAAADQLGGTEWPDIRIVDWDPDANAAEPGSSFVSWQHAFTMTDGRAGLVPAIVPSARMLSQDLRARPSAVTDVPPIAFFGDPTSDLPGPWLEAAAWHRLYGNEVEVRMGRAATADAFMSALADADVVVVSAHASVAEDGTLLGLRLIDDILSYADLMDVSRPVRAQQVVLSCCSAAALSVRNGDEMLGLATALLARGARQVLAPVIPIPDVPAALIGVRIAAELRVGRSLREALSEVSDSLLNPNRQFDLEVDVDLPPELARLCPFDLDSIGPLLSSISQRGLAWTLLQYALYGGDNPDAPPRWHS